MIVKFKCQGVYLEAHTETDWDGDPYIKHLYADPKQDICDLFPMKELEEFEQLIIKEINAI